MRKPNLTGAAIVVLMFVVASCAGDSGADPITTSSTASEPTTTTSDTDGTASEGSGEASITIENFAFSGAASVTVGTTVTVTNQDGVTHTWTSADDVWNSGGISSGESFEFTFEEPGEYAYLCTIHPTMKGTISVEA